MTGITLHTKRQNESKRQTLDRNTKHIHKKRTKLKGHREKEEDHRANKLQETKRAVRQGAERRGKGERVIERGRVRERRREREREVKKGTK